MVGSRWAVVRWIACPPCPPCLRSYLALALGGGRDAVVTGQGWKAVDLRQLASRPMATESQSEAAVADSWIAGRLKRGRRGLTSPGRIPCSPEKGACRSTSCAPRLHQSLTRGLLRFLTGHSRGVPSGPNSGKLRYSRGHPPSSFGCCNSCLIKLGGNVGSCCKHTQPPTSFPKRPSNDSETCCAPCILLVVLSCYQ